MKNIQDPLYSVIRKLTSPTILKEYQALQKWNELVGEKIAAVSEAEKVVSGVLYVKVKDHVWRNELKMLSGRLLEKYKEIMGEEIIKQIKFKQ
jgi:predicted nucleic acid-binding Zn ribbon protein